jgi:2-haloalkanoic acid dehalogenase type II
MSIARPTLFTFDVFGTVLDWRLGLTWAIGRPMSDAEFDAVVDRQGELEKTFAPYAEIVARSLVDVMGVTAEVAARIGRDAGRWPLFPDSKHAMQRLRAVARCVATTNSDARHGEDVRAQLGGPASMDGWLCAGELGFYKPDPRVWEAASRALDVPFGPHWWHVSAYADYDLAIAKRLGLTTVFIRRPHARPGSSDLDFGDLAALAAHVERR